MADTNAPPPLEAPQLEAPQLEAPKLEDLQHWTWVMGRAQQMLLESGLEMPAMPAFDPGFATQVQDYWAENLKLWQAMFVAPTSEPVAVTDKRFAAPQWRTPAFDFIRQSYGIISDQILQSVDALPAVDPRQKEQMRFAARGFIDAMSPSNFALTNPVVLEKAIETNGQSLLKGLQNMLADLGKGQLTHTDSTAFEVGRNIANTPGKVILRTDLFELIQYTPTTGTVDTVPLLIFPPWINRFYILDLNPEKSFIRWAVGQGLSVFVVSWRSADASMKDIAWDDYVAAQVEAIDAVRGLLDVEGVHAIGYCVAGTTLAATLAVLAARGEADKVKSATFFTAQVDFAAPGDLNLFIDDKQLETIAALSPEGFLDGKFMALTFNLLRGRDLIWNYVTNNYLLGQEYPPFDLLHWNGDTTNLPSKWHLSYLTDLYRDNRLVEPGALSVGGTAIDLRLVKTPAYIQAGREDHIAPPESVWKITEHFTGPMKFVLAGSGHIAGVVNPPAAGKYQYWTNSTAVDSLESFIQGATETKGSWWPDWRVWLRGFGDAEVAATGARQPGNGALAALDDAPGRYVRDR